MRNIITRLLVVEIKGMPISLVVDAVREVMHINQADVEPPPPVCKGVEKEFLNGIVKMDKGKRLILILNLSEVVSIEMDTQTAENEASKKLADQTAQVSANVEEEQLVSFQVAGEGYAFHIDKVREILKVLDVTVVPNVDDYVKGLLTVRNQLLPILDFRGLLNMRSLVSERHSAVNKALDDHNAFLDNLKNALASGSAFKGNLDIKASFFTKWIENYNTSSVEVEVILKKLKKARVDFYDATISVLELRKTSKDQSLSIFEEKISPMSKYISDSLTELKDAIEAHISEDQRVLVVEAAGMTIGYLVDSVDEVLRIPKSIIDETPAMASSNRKELKGVAKLNNGERLIMIMDESALVSKETSRMLSNIQEEMEMTDKIGEKQSLEQKSMDEEQLVTFSINKEEYGIRIMQVQEINRVAEITRVPRSPRFIDGMTNLRGNVIPVINIRELFGMENRVSDDRTRIIIVDISGNRTGLRVDQVNEVLRLSKHEIEKTPSILTSGGANRFMMGICKIDSGKRMVILLDVGKILDEKELQTLGSIMNDTDEESLKTAAGASYGEQYVEKKKGKPAKKKLEIAE